MGAPEGWYEYSNGKMKWHDAEREAGAHLYLFVLDGADGRIVPSLTIHATLQKVDGAVVDDKNIPFAWMPLINGYGENFKTSGEGEYALRLSILPPTFQRHDPYNGDRYTQQTISEISLSWKNQSGALLSEKMEEHQSLAQMTGAAYENTLKEMFHQANDGKTATKGNYFIAMAVEYAEGWWLYKADKFLYLAENDMSGKTNAHVEVAVCDTGSKRFLHDLDVTATLYDENNIKIGERNEPFMWHPWLFHYGENWRIPKASRHYRLHVHISPPPYRRYGKMLGKQFTEAVDLDFDNVELKTGQK